MRNTGPNKCNQSGWFDHVANASLPTIRLLFVIWTNAPFLLQIVEAYIIDRYNNFIFAGRKISRNSIRSGYYFRGRKISRKIQIREYIENFLHAKNWCYTVFKKGIRINIAVTRLVT